jgi:flagellar hook assembly protein FlgD
MDKVLDKNYADASKGETVKIKVKTAAIGVHIKLKAYNLTGEMVRHYEFDSTLAGWNEIAWDLKNDAGKTLGQGIYFVRIEAEGSAVMRKVYIIK